MQEEELEPTESTEAEEATESIGPTESTEPTEPTEPDDNDGQGQENIYIGAPDNYDYTQLDIPQNYQFDSALADKFSPVAKELNLSQQGVNKLCKFFVDYQQGITADAEQKLAAYKQQEKAKIKASYEKLLNTDKEIGGGDKDKMNAYIDVADVGYNSFANDELKSLLQEYSLDYHPAVIKHFYRLGKLCGNDKIEIARQPVGTKKDIAEILYGTD